MIELKVILDPQSGQLHINGPVHDKITCIGMLELAKQTIIGAPREQPRIVGTGLPLPPFPNRTPANVAG